jgi:hypothetical protein
MAKSGERFPNSAEQGPMESGLMIVRMKRVMDASEVLGTVATPEGACEVCASATASYDEDQSRLEVRLEAFLRTTDLRTKERRLSAKWLPGTETLCEPVGPEETIEVARDMFHRWVRKVREASPRLQPG